MQSPAANTIHTDQHGEQADSAGTGRRKHTVASFLLQKMIAEQQTADSGSPENEKDGPAPLARDEDGSGQERQQPPEKKAEISCLPIPGGKVMPRKNRFALVPDFDSQDLLSTMTAGFLEAAEKQGATAVLISSCNVREGKSTTALNLAKGLVLQTNLRVIVLDANPDNPMLHMTMGIPASPGLSDYLFGRAGYLQIIHHSRMYGYFFTTFGSNRFGRFVPFTGRQRERFRQLITKLKSQFDYILVDGSSLFGPSDPLVIAPDMDGILLVVECERTRWEVLSAGEKKIRKKGIPTLGIALNKRKYYIPRALYE